MASGNAPATALPAFPFDPSPFFDPRVSALDLKQKADYRHVVNLSSNESDLAGLRTLFRRYLDAAPETVATRYPDWPRHIDETAAFYGVRDSNVAFDAGSDGAIRTILSLLGRACGRVILQEPNYPNYRYYASMAGCQIIALRHPADQWGETVADLAQPLLSASPPALVVVTSPNGFTGTSIPLSEMASLCDLCAQHNHVLVIDEAYAPFGVIPHRSLLDRYEGVVIVRSFSKSCGMAGLRLGLAIADSRIIAHLRRGCGVNGVSAIATGFLSYCMARPDEVGAQRSLVDAVRNRFATDIRHTFRHWRVPPSSANFLLLDTGSAEVADAVAEHLATRLIVVRHFRQGPAGLRGCLRMTVSDAEIMNRVRAELQKFVSTREPAQ
nr:histidinol-phosphate transaminase [Burkholderia diffusa]